MDDLELIFDRALHCQKMVDFGGEGWDKYAEELATIIAEFPARVASYAEKEVEEAKGKIWGATYIFLHNRDRELCEEWEVELKSNEN